MDWLFVLCVAGVLLGLPLVGYLISLAPRFFAACVGVAALVGYDLMYHGTIEITDEMGLRWLGTSFLLLFPSAIIAVATGSFVRIKVARWSGNDWGGDATGRQICWTTLGLAVAVRLIDHAARYALHS